MKAIGKSWIVQHKIHSASNARQATGHKADKAYCSNLNNSPKAGLSQFAL